VTVTESIYEFCLEQMTLISLLGAYKFLKLANLKSKVKQITVNMGIVMISGEFRYCAVLSCYSNMRLAWLRK